MASQYVVRNVTEGDIATADGVFIYCVGFETRSSFIIKEIRPGRMHLAVVYGSGRTLSFEDNLAFAKKEGFRLVEDTREEIEAKLRNVVIPEIRRVHGSVHVVVDVSSMDRGVMASVLISVLDEMASGDTLKVLYAPSEFREPKLELLPIRRIGAVHPRISGEVDSPRKDRALFLGVGFEYGVSLNVMDNHEPDVSFIFRPQGFDERFANRVASANFYFDFGEQRDCEIIDYHLSNSSGVYDVISSLVVSMKHSTSILAVPLGPKILSAVMILTGYVHQPSVSVIRYSLASWNYHHDVTAAGMVVGFEVRKIGRGDDPHRT
jgi:hypothetical protein